MTSSLDERRGVPSCSGLERLEACPPSFSMEQGMSDVTGEDAASGTRIHRWLETEAPEDWNALSADEQDTATRCLDQANDLASLVGPVRFKYRELRLGLDIGGGVHSPKEAPARIYRVTGKADLVCVGDDTTLVIDYKTGRGEQSAAAENRQLRGLAVFAGRYFPPKRVVVAVVQPWAGQPSVAEYDSAALDRASAWLANLLEEARRTTHEDASAGDHCQYCRAKPVCPAFRAAALAPVQTLTSTPLPADDDAKKAALFARSMEIPAETLGALLDQRRLLGWYVSAIEGAARKRIDEGENIPGWALKATNPRESITNVGKVWEHLQPLGCSAGDFAAACTMTKTALNPLVRKVTGTKGRELAAAMAGVLEGAVTLGKPSRQLVSTNEPASLEDAE
jgi:hypothetical protein